jgi:hypothetical protein
MTLMAGGEAERVVFDCVVGDASDTETIAALLTADDNEAALREQVYDFLALNAGTVRYLAAKLRRHGALDGAEVERIVFNRTT